MNAAQRHDVVVVGGGPAGSAAGTALARAGLDVLVCDRAQFPRDKCCGDGLTTDALRRLERLGLRPETLASYAPADRLALRSPSGRTARLSFPRDHGVYAAAVRRVELDAELLAGARRAGAAVAEARPLVSVEAPATGDDAVTCRLGDDDVAARYLIGADGAWSPLRRAIGGPQPGPRWLAFSAYARSVRPAHAGEMWVWFEDAHLPGYAWSFPLASDVANVGVCLERGPHSGGRELASAARALLESAFLVSLLGPAARIEGALRAWPIPSGYRDTPPTARDGRVLFAGDAAGAADPMTGEGIAQALAGGESAADAVVAHFGDPAAAGDAYGAALAATLGADHRVAGRLGAVLASPLGVRLAVALAATRPASPERFARWLFEDWPRGLPLRPGSWAGALRRRPGAYAPGG